MIDFNFDNLYIARLLMEANQKAPPSLGADGHFSLCGSFVMRVPAAPTVGVALWSMPQESGTDPAFLLYIDTSGRLTFITGGGAAVYAPIGTFDFRALGASETRKMYWGCRGTYAGGIMSIVHSFKFEDSDTEYTASDTGFISIPTLPSSAGRTIGWGVNTIAIAFMPAFTSRFGAGPMRLDVYSNSAHVPTALQMVNAAKAAGDAFYVDGDAMFANSAGTWCQNVGIVTSQSSGGNFTPTGVDQELGWVGGSRTTYTDTMTFSAGAGNVQVITRAAGWTGMAVGSTVTIAGALNPANNRTVDVTNVSGTNLTVRDVGNTGVSETSTANVTVTENWSTSIAVRVGANSGAFTTTYTHSMRGRHYHRDSYIWPTGNGEGVPAADPVADPVTYPPRRQRVAFRLANSASAPSSGGMRHRGMTHQSWGARRDASFMPGGFRLPDSGAAGLAYALGSRFTGFGCVGMISTTANAFVQRDACSYGIYHPTLGEHPYTSNGSIHNLDASGGNDFCRYGVEGRNSGTQNSMTIGGGHVFVGSTHGSATQTLGISFKLDPRMGLTRATPMRTRAYLLRYPGGKPSVTVQGSCAATGLNNTTGGSYSPSMTVDSETLSGASTTVHTATVASVVTATNKTTITFSGSGSEFSAGQIAEILANASDRISAGLTRWVGYNQSRLNVADVTNISFSVDTWTVEFSPGFIVAPQIGDTIHFGLREFEPLDADNVFDANNDFRNLKVTGTGTGGPLVVVAAGIYAPTVAGDVVSSFGCGGWSYTLWKTGGTPGHFMDLAVAAGVNTWMVSDTAVTSDADAELILQRCEEALPEADRFVYYGPPLMQGTGVYTAGVIGTALDGTARQRFRKAAKNRDWGMIDGYNAPGHVTWGRRMTRGFVSDGTHFSGYGAADFWTYMLEQEAETALGGRNFPLWHNTRIRAAR